MRTTGLVTALLWTAWAAAELAPVQVLEHTAEHAVLGNDHFSVRLARTGALSQVKAGGIEYLWLGSLYTSPVVPETGQGLRAVQIEGGIGPTPPMPAPVQVSDHCEVTIIYDAARAELFGGAPVYRLTQTVQVHPGGWIRLYYRFDWARLLVMQGASLYLALTGEVAGNRSYSADYTDRLTGGIFDVAVGTGRIDAIQGRVRCLTVDCPAGPLLMWLEGDEQVSAQYWGNERIAVVVAVPGTGRSEPLYPGTTSVMLVNIKLPVSQ